MRESLLKNFQAIWIDNLNGDKYKTGKVIPGGLPAAGTSDQSIFSTEHDPRGIQVGTAITTYLKRPLKKREQKSIAVVHYRDFWGRAASKRDALMASLEMTSWSSAERDTAAARPEGPRVFREFRPTDRSRWKLLPAKESGFEAWAGLR